MGTATMGAGGSSTDVAELLSAFAGHRGAPFRPFDPVVAPGTLLELGSPDELNEILIVFAEGVVDLVFSAGHSSVVEALALETVVLATGRTAVIVQALVKLEDSGASCCGAPGCCGILLDELIKAEFLELLFQDRVCKLINI